MQATWYYFIAENKWRCTYLWFVPLTCYEDWFSHVNLFRYPDTNEIPFIDIDMTTFVIHALKAEKAYLVSTAIYLPPDIQIVYG